MAAAWWPALPLQHTADHDGRPLALLTVEKRFQAAEERFAPRQRLENFARAFRSRTSLSVICDVALGADRQ